MAEPGRTFEELYDDNPDPADIDFTDIMVSFDRSRGQVYGNQIGHVADKVFTHPTFGQLDTRVQANTNAIALLGGGGGVVDPPPDPGDITVDPYTFNGPDGGALPSPWVTTGSGTAVIQSAAALQTVSAGTNTELITAILDLSTLPAFTGYPGTSYKVTFQRSIDDLFGTLAIITRFRYDVGTGARYELNHTPGAGGWRVQKFTAGGVFGGTVAAGTYSYTVGRLSHEAQVVGTKLSIRWWPTSGGTPPTTWQITDLIMDANLTNVGFGQVLYSGASGATAPDTQRRAAFDEVGFLPVAEPIDTSGGGGTTTNGAFTTVGADIRTPEGYKFYGVGVNGWGRNRTAIGGADTGYWVGDSTHYPLDGHITGANSAQAYGFNMVRVISAQALSSPGASGNTLNNQSYGQLTLADECIAAGIVAMGPPIWSYTNAPNKDPSGATVIANPLIQYMDDWVARYKPGGTYTGPNSYAANTIGTHAAGGSPYAWLNPLNEPWDYNDAAGWVSCGTALYNRAYTAGWRGIFVWEAMGWGNYIGAVNSGDSTVAASIPNFLSGKSNCVIGWHNYGGTDAENDTALSKLQSLGIPVIVGETSAPWDENVSGSLDGIPVSSMRQARSYAFRKAWTFGAPGYCFWLGGAWNGYWGTPRVNSGPYWDTSKSLSISGQNLLSLAANKPAPKAV